MRSQSSQRRSEAFFLGTALCDPTLSVIGVRFVQDEIRRGFVFSKAYRVTVIVDFEGFPTERIPLPTRDEQFILWVSRSLIFTPIRVRIGEKRV